MGCCLGCGADRRVRELDEGKVETISWSVVKARLEERLRSR
jgi:hypothetical protein